MPKLIEYLTQFLEDSPISIKKKLIFYVSGSFSLPAFKKIRFRSEKSDAVFGGTCLLEMAIPKDINSLEQLRSVILSVLPKEVQ